MSTNSPPTPANTTANAGDFWTKFATDQAGNPVFLGLWQWDGTQWNQIFGN